MGLLFNDKTFISFLDGEKVNVIDGGARGNLFEPFNKITTDSIHVVRLDPDPDAPIDHGESETVIRGALWDKCEALDFNITNQPAVSSVLKPNLKLIGLMWKDKKMVKARSIREKIKVQGYSIDELVEKGTIPKIDFIKLDIHGSEFECICGALNTMKTNTIGVLAETWTIPVYEGQRLHGEFEHLLNQNKFYLFDQLKTGGAKRNTKYSNFHKHQIFKYDSLYMRNVLEEIEQANKILILKNIAIADIFGFYGYALQILEESMQNGVIDQNIYDYTRKILVSRSDFVTKYKQKFVGKLSELISKF